MNRFTNRAWSKIQCEMILSFLGYADYYRPRYFLLENVRNFVSFNKGQTFRLTLATLLEMGYQVKRLELLRLPPFSGLMDFSCFSSFTIFLSHCRSGSECFKQVTMAFLNRENELSSGQLVRTNVCLNGHSPCTFSQAHN